MEKTLTIFRKFKDGGDVIAFFPEIEEGIGKCLSYQHIGQHGAADYLSCLSITVPASESEYSLLKREIERIGYNVEVRKKYIHKKGT